MFDVWLYTKVPDLHTDNNGANPLLVKFWLIKNTDLQAEICFGEGHKTIDGLQKREIPQSGICPAPCVPFLFTVVFAWKCRLSVCAHMDNAAYIMFIMWHSISGLDTWYHFRFNISCGVAVKVRSHQEKFQVIFLWGVEGADNFLEGEEGTIFWVAFIF